VLQGAVDELGKILGMYRGSIFIQSGYYEVYSTVTLEDVQIAVRGEHWISTRLDAQGNFPVLKLANTLHPVVLDMLAIAVPDELVPTYTSWLIDSEVRTDYLTVSRCFLQKVNCIRLVNVTDTFWMYNCFFGEAPNNCLRIENTDYSGMPAFIYANRFKGFRGTAIDIDVAAGYSFLYPDISGSFFYTTEAGTTGIRLNRVFRGTIGGNRFHEVDTGIVEVEGNRNIIHNNVLVGVTTPITTVGALTITPDNVTT